MSDRFHDVLSRIPPWYTSTTQAADDLAEGIIAAGSTDEIMQVIQWIGDSIDGADQGVVLATAYAIVAKRSTIEQSG